MSSELSTSGWIDHLGRFFAKHRRLMVSLGNLESRFVSEALGDVAIRSPIYVAGIARSGSTLLLEILNRVSQVVTHQYQDYPFLYTPYWWHTYLRMVPGKTDHTPQERAHKDRIFITPRSPEAMEEVLWMSFFAHIHDDQTNQVLDGGTRCPEFEDFYRDHIRKLLVVRKGQRYASKGNYNLTRLAYLHQIFPDARFVVPIREPRAHVASLVKQHRLFVAGERANPKALAHMQRLGHYEFGLDRRVINVGDGEQAERIRSAWDEGRDVEGYSRLWSEVYGFVHRQLAEDPALREQTLLLRYEDLCRDPAGTLTGMLGHVGLEAAAPETVRHYSDKISPPTYYDPGFGPRELHTLDALTRDTAKLFGYGTDPGETCSERSRATP